MAIVVEEKWESPATVTGDHGRVEVRYVISGSDNQAEVMAAVWAQAPLTFDVYGDGALIYLRNSIGDTVRTAPETWESSILYTPTDFETAVCRMHGELGGATEHITESLGTRLYDNGYGLVAATTAINTDENGKVHGLDRPKNSFRFRLPKKLADVEVTDALLAMLYDFNAKKNSSAWRNFQAGEVVLLDTIFDRNQDGTWDFEFYFEARPNMYARYIAEGMEWAIGPFDVGGWDYLEVRWMSWPVYVAAEVTGIEQVPIAVLIHEVIEGREFNNLPLTP